MLLRFWAQLSRIGQRIWWFLGQRLRLEQAIAESERAQAELVRNEKLATLGQLAGSLAHELRNPLAAIRNAAYYLGAARRSELSPKTLSHLEVIDTQVERANRIIEALLDFVQVRRAQRRPVAVL